MISRVRVMAHEPHARLEEFICDQCVPMAPPPSIKTASCQQVNGHSLFANHNPLMEGTGKPAHAA
jgi:hypothetical protein